jgi:hypothetical protein
MVCPIITALAAEGTAEASRDSAAATGDIATGSRITAEAAAVIWERGGNAAESSRIS